MKLCDSQSKLSAEQVKDLRVCFVCFAFVCASLRAGPVWHGCADREGFTSFRMLDPQPMRVQARSASSFGARSAAVAHVPHERNPRVRRVQPNLVRPSRPRVRSDEEAVVCRCSLAASDELESRLHPPHAIAPRERPPNVLIRVHSPEPVLGPPVTSHERPRDPLRRRTRLRARGAETDVLFASLARGKRVRERWVCRGRACQKQHSRRVAVKPVRKPERSFLGLCQHLQHPFAVNP